MYPIEEFDRLLKEDMTEHGYLDPDSLVMAARAKQAEFEAALEPAEVVFDFHWPRGQDAPSLAMGLAMHHGQGDSRYHAICFPQHGDFKVVDEALAYVKEHAERLKAKLREKE